MIQMDANALAAACRAAENARPAACSNARLAARRADENARIYWLLTALRDGALPGRYRYLRALVAALLDLCNDWWAAGNGDPAVFADLLRGFGVPILRMAHPAIPDRHAAVRERIEQLLNRFDAASAGPTGT